MFRMSYRGQHSTDRFDTKRAGSTPRDQTEQTTIKRYQAHREARSTDDPHGDAGDGLEKAGRDHERVEGAGDRPSEDESSDGNEDTPRLPQRARSQNESMRMRREPDTTSEERVEDDDIVEVVEDHSSDEQKRARPIRSQVIRKPAGSKKGTTRMPKRLASQAVVTDLGYAFDEEEHFLVLRTPLEKDDIDQIIEKSKPYLDIRRKRQSPRTQPSHVRASSDPPDSRWKALSAHKSISTDATTGKEVDERRLLKMALSGRRWG